MIRRRQPPGEENPALDLSSLVDVINVLAAAGIERVTLSGFLEP